MAVTSVPAEYEKIIPLTRPAHRACLRSGRPYVLPEVGTADFWLSAVEAYRKLLPNAGVMTREEAEAWAARLRGDSDDGVFFASSNYYGYVARPP